MVSTEVPVSVVLCSVVDNVLTLCMENVVFKRCVTTVIAPGIDAKNHVIE